MRAGNAAAKEAAASPLTSLELDLDEPELLGFEIETYESVVFDTGRQAPDAARRSASPGAAKDTQRTTGGQASKAGGKEGSQGTGKPPAGRPPSILDPLFDEDD